MTRSDGEPVFVCLTSGDILPNAGEQVKPFVYKDLAMSLQTLPAPRFVRRTSLAPGEYRKNFRQIDREVIDAVTSPEADRVTPLMSKIYLRLSNAPDRFWEREGVLRFEAEQREGGGVRAWELLCETLGVASATANKALRWMHERGVVGYFAGKNGVGIRIFLNRASSSIGGRTAGKKILEFPPASSPRGRTSPNEAAFIDSFAVSEVLETELNPRAPENGAETRPVGRTPSTESRPQTPGTRTPAPCDEREPGEVRPTSVVPVAEIVGRLRAELEPSMREAAARAAAQSASLEMERTREWFETKALPKAVRVAQRETFDLLRRRGSADPDGGRGSAGLEVGRGAGDHKTAARPLTPEEIREAAEICVAFLEAQGKSVEATLSEISSERGGWLLPEDVPRVRDLAAALASGDRAPRREGGGK